MYKYDIINNTYTKLDDTPYKVYAVRPLKIGNNVYIYPTGSAGIRRWLILSMSAKEYEDNSIVIAQDSSNRYNTELLSSSVENGLQTYFNNVYYYTTTDGLIDTIPTYYGDGTQWIKFKN